MIRTTDRAVVQMIEVRNGIRRRGMGRSLAQDLDLRS